VFEDRLTKWLDRGAIPTDTVRSLLRQIGFTEKYHKAKRGEDTTGIALQTTITERRKKTRKMKKAAVATTETAAAEEKSESTEQTESAEPAEQTE